MEEKTSRIIKKQNLFALVFLTALTIIILTGTAFITQSQNEVLPEGPTTQCNNQIDKDGDGHIGLLDLGCENEEDYAETTHGKNIPVWALPSVEISWASQS